MKFGVSTASFTYMSLEETLKYLQPLGVDAIEISAGGLLSKTHANPGELLANPGEIQKLRDLLEKYGIVLSNLKVHGNPVHPDKAVAARHHQDFEEAIRLSEKLGLKYILNFSGCPGDPTGSKYPNWVIQPFPVDFMELYEYQWNDVLIPYWTKMAQFAKDHGLERIGIEMYPGFSVYNPESFLKLHRAVGDVIGCGFDPSHIMPQGVDPSVAIRAIGSAICHVHAKDSSENLQNIALNGRLDPKMFTDTRNRAWIYRTLGYGHGEQIWRDIISSLTMVGYDGVVSIEHDDCMMTTVEGFEKSVEFLNRILVREKASGMWWNHH